LTTTEVLTALVDGVTVSCRMHAANGVNPTLAVDGTAAKAIQSIQGTAISPGALFAGGIYRFTYYQVGDVWVCHGGPGLGTKYIGEVFDYAGSSAPALSLLCDGSLKSRTTYAALFSVIGTTYGAGDGSTTFAVPDARGRVIAGVDGGANRLTNQTNGVAGTLAAAGGEERHQITAAELASHGHANTLAVVAGGAHGHATKMGGVSSGSDFVNPNGGLAMTNSGGLADEGANTGSAGTTPGTQIAGAADHTHALSGGISNAGSDTPHNNIQPTLVLNKCIYAGA
jgi:microcystin-dependent protein